MPKHTFIYALCNPDTKIVRYIGKSNNPYNRYKQHLSPSNLKNKTYKDYWIKYLLKCHKKPKLLILKKVLMKNWQKAERQLISYYRKRFKLVNIDDGGFPKKLKKQTIDKLKKIKKGRIAWNKGKTSWSKGLHLSKYHRKNIGIANRGNNNGMARVVFQFDINNNLLKRWDCIMDATRHTNIHYTSISKCCKNQRKTAGGFKWKF